MTNDPLTRLSLEAPTDGAVRRFWEEVSRADDSAAGTRLLDRSGREPWDGPPQETGDSFPLHAVPDPSAAGSSRPVRFSARTYWGVSFVALCLFMAGVLLLYGQAG